MAIEDIRPVIRNWLLSGGTSALPFEAGKAYLGASRSIGTAVNVDGYPTYDAIFDYWDECDYKFRNPSKFFCRDRIPFSDWNGDFMDYGSLPPELDPLAPVVDAIPDDGFGYQYPEHPDCQHYHPSHFAIPGHYSHTPARDASISDLELTTWGWGLFTATHPGTPCESRANSGYLICGGKATYDRARRLINVRPRIRCQDPQVFHSPAGYLLHRAILSMLLRGVPFDARYELVLRGIDDGGYGWEQEFGSWDMTGRLAWDDVNQVVYNTSIERTTLQWPQGPPPVPADLDGFLGIRFPAISSDMVVNCGLLASMGRWPPPPRNLYFLPGQLWGLDFL